MIVGSLIATALDEDATERLLRCGIRGVDGDGARQRLDGLVGFPAPSPQIGDADLDRAVVRIQTSGREQPGQIAVVEAEGVAHLVDARQQEEQDRKCDPHGSGCDASSDDPSAGVTNIGAYPIGRRGHTRSCVEEQRRNSTVTQFPDGAVQHEVMNVDERREDHEAGRQVVPEDVAHDPGSEDEQGDAAGHERQEVRPDPPLGIAARTRFALRVVARDP